MFDAEVIIIGAGASGLAAAYELSMSGKKTIVLEARDRIGGRIHTVADERFDTVVEAGAEFVHGLLPTTMQLLNKADIAYSTITGKIYRITNGRIRRTEEFIPGWDELMQKLQQLKEDMPIATFLNHYFGGDQHQELRKTVLEFVQGYDAADAAKASSFALRKEWEQEDDEHQVRIEPGYMGLMNFLAEECRTRGTAIYLKHQVTQINWQKNNVDLITSNGTHFKAPKVITTLPLGIWQAPESKAMISFHPALGDKVSAAQQIGYGGVIKFNFQFTSRFWEEKDAQYPMNDAEFIISDSIIPTWWTQNPKKTAILSGWIAGPKAEALKDATETDLLAKAVQSLSYIFGVDERHIRQKLKASIVSNWITDPFSLGAYSYTTLQSEEAKKVLAKPVDDTLYFAGEALYNGPATGTVEGALVSGREVAALINQGRKII